MRILFDANLSPALVTGLKVEYRGSTHVREVGLQAAPDAQIWEYAKTHGLAIVSTVMHKPVDLATINFPGRSWLGVVVIAAHNAEEALTAPAWLQPRLPELRQRFGVVPLAVDAELLYVGLALVTLFAAGWVALASRAAPRSLAVHSLIALYAIFFANAFIPHVAGSVLLGGYTPGVFSAVTLVAPYCLWYFKRALSERWVGGAGFAAACCVGAVPYVPAVWTLLRFRGR